MKALGWLYAPFCTLLSILHTAFCSVVGLVAMAINANNGDWVMWNVGRVLWSRPLLKWIVGAPLDLDVHPDAQALADRNKEWCSWPTTRACSTSMPPLRRAPPPLCF